PGRAPRRGHPDHRAIPPVGPADARVHRCDGPHAMGRAGARGGPPARRGGAARGGGAPRRRPGTASRPSGGRDRRAPRPGLDLGRAAPNASTPTRLGRRLPRAGRRRRGDLRPDAGHHPSGPRRTGADGGRWRDRVHPRGDEDGEPHHRASGWRRQGRERPRRRRRRRRTGPDHCGRSGRGGGPRMSAVSSLIAGRPADGASGGIITVRNPSLLDDVLSEAALGDASTIVDACRAAREVQTRWSRVPAPVRGRAIQQIGRLVEDNKDALAALITREIGKPYRESLGEVQEVIDTCGFFQSEGRRLYGQTAPSEMPDKQLFTFRAPVGVAAIVTAGNFPVAVPSWYIVPALLCGNAVVWKPAEYTPVTAQA